MNKKALLVIDVQNDFCPGGTLAVKEGDQVIPVINALMPCFSLVVATQDWHPANHISFAGNHPGSRIFDTLMVKGMEQVLWPAHCIAGTQGAAFHPGLDLVPVNLILRKGTRPDLDSYSAFYENDRETATGLDAYLKGLHITDVYLCGLAFDVCVFYSALDSVKCGFRTHVITDGCRGVDLPPGNNKAKAQIMAAGKIELITAEGVCQ